MDGIEYACLMRLQIFIGLGYVLGVLAFGFIIVKDSTDCLISRQYLCQVSTFLMAACLAAFTSFSDYQGYLLFVWIYGFFFGGYSYSIKMFILEKVRARNFNRAWSFLQASQSLPMFVGTPITIFLNDHTASKAGFYLSSGCLALGSLVFFFIDAHKSSKSRLHQIRTHPSTHSAGSAVTQSGTIATGRLSGCSKQNTGDHMLRSGISSIGKSSQHQGLNQETTLLDKSNISSHHSFKHHHEHQEHHHHHDHRPSIISSTGSSSCSAMDQKAKILKSYIESLSTNPMPYEMQQQEEEEIEDLAGESDRSKTASVATTSKSFPPNRASVKDKKSSSSSSGSSGAKNISKKLVNNNSSSNGIILNGDMTAGGSCSSTGSAASSSRSRSNSLFNSLENHAAELTCISEEVFLENLLDDLIWDSSAADAEMTRGALGGLNTDAEGSRSLMTEFGNSILHQDHHRMGKTSEKEQAIKLMIAKRKKQLFDQQNHHHRSHLRLHASLQHLNLNFDGPHHENCPLSQLSSSPDETNSSIDGGGGPASAPDAASNGFIIMDAKKRRIMKKRSNRGARVGASASAGVLAVDHPEASGTSPASAIDLIDPDKDKIESMHRIPPSSPAASSSPGQSGREHSFPADQRNLHENSDAASAGVLSSKDMSINASNDVDECSFCRRPLSSSSSSCREHNPKHPYHQQDHFPIHKSNHISNQIPDVILEQSSSDDEDSGDQMVSSKTCRLNNNIHRKKNNGSMRPVDCNDSFPEDEEDEDDFVDHDEDDDEDEEEGYDEDGHGKTFEQEDTIVYFHREAAAANAEHTASCSITTKAASVMPETSQSMA